VGCFQSRVRISKRRVQVAFRTWQVKAGFDRLYSFHALRHTAVTKVCRASRDLSLAQRFTRHVSPLTRKFLLPVGSGKSFTPPGGAQTPFSAAGSGKFQTPLESRGLLH